RRAVEPTREPTDGERFVGVEVASREHHLERAGATEEARQARGASRARQNAHRHLWLTDDRALGAVAQVERREELATPAARRAVDQADADVRSARQAEE